MSFDEEWFGDCTNTFHEEQKQLAYARRMGLRANWTVGHPPVFDVEGRSIIDIGGGPVSLLLKCVNRGRSVVCDPGEYPWWVRLRYTAADIDYWMLAGEELEVLTPFAEAWIYNVLQHTESPEEVIKNACAAAKTLRIFEWIEIDPYPGHPHRLTSDLLEEWIGQPGFRTTVNESGAVGLAFYGVFDIRE